MMISYQSPMGDVWILAAPAPMGNDTPIMLVEGGAKGFEGTITRQAVKTVTRYGVLSSGWEIPALEMSLEYLIRGDYGDMRSLIHSWRQAWMMEESGDYSTSQQVTPGKLVVTTDVGAGLWTPVVDPVFPDIVGDPANWYEIQETMTCKSNAGCWFGEAESFTGDVEVRALGDRPLSPRLRLLWDGSATTVGFPSGITVKFPAINQPRIINLDRGMSGQVTRLDGSVDTRSWSLLQGLVSGLSLRPGEVSTWKLGKGMALEVTPRYLSPWR